MAKFSPLSATPNDSQPSENNRQRRRKRRTVSITTTSAENYKVGPGRPPREHRFKPGKSGNPKGAKPKPPSIAPDLKLALERALQATPLSGAEPTAKEAGLPEFKVSAWTALFAPKGTPKPTRDRLTDALDEALDDENTRKRLLEFGSDQPGKAQRGKKPLAALVKKELARWTPIIKAAKVKAE